MVWILSLARSFHCGVSENSTRLLMISIHNFNSCVRCIVWQYICFTYERCNMSSINKTSTRVVVNVKKKMWPMINFTTTLASAEVLTLGTKFSFFEKLSYVYLGTQKFRVFPRLSFWPRERRESKEKREREKREQEKRERKRERVCVFVWVCGCACEHVFWNLQCYIFCRQ